MYLKIANEGMLEVAALTLVGASSKAGDDSKIGMFGSGNKYALAYLLRNNFDVRIYSGKDQVTLSTEIEKFRDQEFNIIVINGAKTSITTAMGKDWELWMAIRELYSNAVDEGVLDFVKCEEIDPKDGETHIYIKMTPELSHMMFNINDYIAIDKKVLFESEHGKIYKKHNDRACVYRKGIRCYETKKKSLFDYDFEDLPIDENRYVKYSWYVYEGIQKIISECTDVDIVREFLFAIDQDDQLLEADDTHWISHVDFKIDVVKEVVKDKKIIPRLLAGWIENEDLLKTLKLPTKVYHNFVKLGIPENSKMRTNSVSAYRTVETLSSLQTAISKEVAKFFRECKFDYKYPVEVVEFMSPDVYGTIEGDREKGKILIGVNAYEKGAHFVAMVIIEEYIHLKSGANDCSREFQEASIDLFLSYMKSINAYEL